jgi:membrane protein required for colicin V production
MNWNWVDGIIAVVLLLSVIAGFREGFVRIAIGFAAVVIGFLAAAWFYGLVADPLLPYVKDARIASLVGFMLVLCGVMGVGALIGLLLSRTLKLVGLSFVDRSLGAVVGGVRGAVLLIVFTMILMAFLPRRMPAAIQESELAPYLIGGTRILSELTPYSIRRQIERYHDEFRSVVRGLEAGKTTI